jgi:nitroreductase
MSAKSAVTEYPVHDLIRDRWSPRAFSEKQLSAANLHSLFEAARWAASCFGEQPWSFVVATRSDTAEFEKLASCLAAGNAWAKEASVLVLSVAALNFARNAAPNRHAMHDVGLAMGNLSMQAQSMGIYLHQMGGFDQAKASEVLAIPETHIPVAMIALGYLGDPATLSEDLQKREAATRQRKPQRDFVFSGQWGKSRVFPAT